jgi:RHH-type proline utilization regulon transcriptional repressor/proline dehydrogenase/delta 1-pyrroline-5-carboxylate dehydrogenase
LPLPPELYPDRLNSRGDDPVHEAVLTEMQQALESTPACTRQSRLLRRFAPSAATTRATRVMRNPSDLTDVVGNAADASLADVDDAARVAASDGMQWSKRASDERAAILARAADRIEDARALLIAIAVREAGKTIGNAIGEVREAADFCRYYGAQARRELGGEAVAAIGPRRLHHAVELSAGDLRRRSQRRPRGRQSGAREAGRADAADGCGSRTDLP